MQPLKKLESKQPNPFLTYKTIQQFDRAQLRHLINANSLSEIEDKIIPLEKLTDFFQIPLNGLETNPFNEALATAIGIASTPIDVWVTSLYLFGDFNLGVVALPLSCLAVLAAPVIGYLFFNSTFKELSEQQESRIEFFKLSLLKLSILEYLLVLEKEALKQDIGHLYYEVLSISPVPKKKKTTELIKSTPDLLSPFGTFLTTSSMIYMSYFFGIGTVIENLGYLATASALMSPVGSLMAALFGIAVGIYLGYQQYQEQVDVAYFKDLKQEFKTLVEEKNKEFSWFSNARHVHKILIDSLNKAPKPPLLEVSKLPSITISGSFFGSQKLSADKKVEPSQEQAPTKTRSVMNGIYST